MNKLAKIFTTFTMAAALTATACGLAACGCGSAEETTTEAVVTLPVDEFDDTSDADRLKQIKEDIDTIDELQKSGVDTDEKKAAYNAAVEDLVSIAPEFQEIVDAGKDNYNIDIDQANQKYNEASSEYESLSAEASSVEDYISTATDENGNYTIPVETDENGDAEVIELPTIKIK